MYPSIPREALYHNLGQLWDLWVKNLRKVGTYSEKRKDWIRVDTTTYTATFHDGKGKQEGYIYYNKETFLRDVRFLLENSYTSHGSKLYLPIHGIPMGSGPGVFLAILYMFWQEYDWLRRCHVGWKVGGKEMFARVQPFCRQVDNLLFLDTDNPESFMYRTPENNNLGIYEPKQVEITEEQCSDKCKTVLPGDNSKHKVFPSLHTHEFQLHVKSKRCA